MTPDKAKSILRSDLESAYGRLPRCAARTARDMATRIGFSNRPADDGWTGHFSNLILLYPWHFAPKRLRGSEEVRKATLAHALLLVHSVVDDRQIDGQIGLDPAGMLASRALLLEALGLLRTIPAPDPGLRERAFEAILRAYLDAQTRTLGETRDSSVPELERLAAGRAAPGALAPLTLLCMESRDTLDLRTAWKAFAALGVAYQWADDASDWRADLMQPDAGRSNLALALDRRTARAGSESGARSIGLEVAAIDRAEAKFAESARLHERLGRADAAEEIRAVAASMRLRRDRAVARFATALHRRLDRSVAIAVGSAA